MQLSFNKYLEYRTGKLFCEETSLESLARQYGTPLYVYSQSAILENFHTFERNLSRVSSLVCYSVKANSNLAFFTCCARPAQALTLFPAVNSRACSRWEQPLKKLSFPAWGKRSLKWMQRWRPAS